MIAVHLDQVTVSYLRDPIFSDLSWDIHDDRCVGLIGPNGSGKSTLLKLISRQISSDTGYVVNPKPLRIGYLSQEPVLQPGHTVWEETITASTELAQIEEQLSAIEARLADPAVYGDERKLQRTLEAQTALLESFERLGGLSFTSRVRAILVSLGFEDQHFSLQVDTLSGGQKKLLGLAKLLVVQPDLLLLDEPDNHLDLRGKGYIEQLISTFKGGVILVSHDRYLLDVVSDEIAELEDGNLTLFSGNYSEYAFEKQRRLLRQQQLFHVQQREISRLEQAANRLLMWGRSHDNEKLIKRGKSILRRLDRIERIDRPVLERKRMKLELAGWRGSNKVLEIQDLDKVFPAAPDLDSDEDVIMFAGLEMLLWHGERVGLVGPNGAGKSLLFRTILDQEVPTAGRIKIGPSVTMGYYAQEHQTLDYHKTPLDTVRLSVVMSESNAVSFLGRFLFTYEQSRSPISNLSGGERSRLQMALLMLSDANFLLLDEPTNNLDIASAEVLEGALEDFEGTVLIISHDRYFLDRVVDRIVDLKDGGLVEYVGNYSDYQAAADGLA